MIIVLKPHASEAEIQQVLDKIESLGLTPTTSRGTERTVVGALGDERKLADGAFDSWLRWSR